MLWQRWLDLKVSDVYVERTDDAPEVDTIMVLMVFDTPTGRRGRAATSPQKAAMVVQKMKRDGWKVVAVHGADEKELLSADEVSLTL